MDRGRVSVLVYHGKPETSVQVRKGQLPRISEATSIGYELRSYRMDVVVHDPTGKPLAPGYRILTKNGIRVAFIGMTTPLVQLWTAKQLEGCTVTSAVEETRKIIESI